MMQTDKRVEVTTRTAELIGASAEVHMAASELWIVVEALEALPEGSIGKRSAAKMAEQFSAALMA